MGKLLSANLVRLKQNVVFLFSEIFMLIYGLYLPISLHYDNIRNAHDAAPDKGFCAYVIPSCIFMAFICCTYCGEEYEGRTIQNKIIIGHSRKTIYIAQLLSCIIASAVLCITFLLPSLTIGRVLLGKFQRASYELLLYFLSGIFCVIACTSLFCLLVTSMQKRVSGTALTLFVMLIIIYIGIIVYQDLHIPPETFQYHMVDGEMIQSYGENPHYPKGTLRFIFECLYDFLPSGQAWQFNTMTADNLPRMILSSFILLLMTSISGIKIFEKKDLK